ncbi:hypothetical protein ACN47E_008414 [Coniothyrium glycines]
MAPVTLPGSLVIHFVLSIFTWSTQAAVLRERAVAVTPTNSSVPGRTYSGCYTDTNPAILSLISPQYLLGGPSYVSLTAMTWTACSTFCSAYQFAGISGGNTCRCANTFAYAPLVQLDAVCLTPCTGNLAQSCGGVNRITVFRTGTVSASSSAVPSVASPLLVASSTVRVSSALLPSSSTVVAGSPLLAVPIVVSPQAVQPALSSAITSAIVPLIPLAPQIVGVVSSQSVQPGVSLVLSPSPSSFASTSTPILGVTTPVINANLGGINLAVPGLPAVSIGLPAVSIGSGVSINVAAVSVGAVNSPTPQINVPTSSVATQSLSTPAIVNLFVPPLGVPLPIPSNVGVSTLSTPSLPSTSVALPFFNLPSVALPSVNLQGVAQPSLVIPSVAIPSVAIPSVAIPSVAIPSVALPGVALPDLAIPSVALPGLAIPSIAIPSVAIPSIALPGVALPSVALPSVALPDLAVPSVALPGVALPSVALPELAIPSVALPGVALPSVAQPSILIELPSIPTPSIPIPAVVLSVPTGIELDAQLSGSLPKITEFNIPALISSVVNQLPAIPTSSSSYTTPNFLPSFGAQPLPVIPSFDLPQAIPSLVGDIASPRVSISLNPGSLPILDISAIEQPIFTPSLILPTFETPSPLLADFPLNLPIPTGTLINTEASAVTEPAGFNPILPIVLPSLQPTQFVLPTPLGLSNSLPGLLSSLEAQLPLPITAPIIIPTPLLSFPEFSAPPLSPLLSVDLQALPQILPSETPAVVLPVPIVTAFDVTNVLGSLGGLPTNLSPPPFLEDILPSPIFLSGGSQSYLPQPTGLNDVFNNILPLPELPIPNSVEGISGILTQAGDQLPIASSPINLGVPSSLPLATGIPLVDPVAELIPEPIIPIINQIGTLLPDLPLSEGVPSIPGLSEQLPTLLPDTPLFDVPSLISEVEQIPTSLSGLPIDGIVPSLTAVLEQIPTLLPELPQFDLPSLISEVDQLPSSLQLIQDPTLATGLPLGDIFSAVSLVEQIPTLVTGLPSNDIPSNIQLDNILSAVAVVEQIPALVTGLPTNDGPWTFPLDDILSALPVLDQVQTIIPETLLNDLPSAVSILEQLPTLLPSALLDNIPLADSVIEQLPTAVPDILFDGITSVVSILEQLPTSLPSDPLDFVPVLSQGLDVLPSLEPQILEPAFPVSLVGPDLPFSVPTPSLPFDLDAIGLIPGLATSLLSQATDLAEGINTIPLVPELGDDIPLFSGLPIPNLDAGIVTSILDQPLGALPTLALDIEGAGDLSLGGNIDSLLPGNGLPLSGEPFVPGILSDIQAVTDIVAGLPEVPTQILGELEPLLDVLPTNTPQGDMGALPSGIFNDIVPGLLSDVGIPTSAPPLITQAPTNVLDNFPVLSSVLNIFVPGVGPLQLTVQPLSLAALPANVLAALSTELAAVPTNILASLPATVLEALPTKVFSDIFGSLPTPDLEGLLPTPSVDIDLDYSISLEGALSLPGWSLPTDLFAPLEPISNAIPTGGALPDNIQNIIPVNPGNLWTNAQLPTSLPQITSPPNFEIPGDINAPLVHWDISSILSALPTNPLGGIITEVFGAIPTSVLQALPTDALGGIRPSALNIIPTDILSSLATKLATITPTAVQPLDFSLPSLTVNLQAVGGVALAPVLPLLPQVSALYPSCICEESVLLKYAAALKTMSLTRVPLVNIVYIRTTVPGIRWQTARRAATTVTRVAYLKTITACTGTTTTTAVSYVTTVTQYAATQTLYQNVPTATRGAAFAAAYTAESGFSISDDRSNGNPENGACDGTVTRYRDVAVTFTETVTVTAGFVPAVRRGWFGL